MTKLWQELLGDDADDDVVKVTAEKAKAPTDQAHQEPKSKRPKRTIGIAISTELGPTSWVERLQQALAPVYMNLAQKNTLNLFCPCSGASAVIQGLQVPPAYLLSTHCALFTFDTAQI